MNVKPSMVNFKTNKNLFSINENLLLDLRLQRLVNHYQLICYNYWLFDDNNTNDNNNFEELNLTLISET